MSREFVRNIKNTKIKGDIKEPLGTNLQNDLLSDDEDVAIRNQNDYHILTDNIKTITSANELLTVNKTGKNSVELDVKPSEDIDLTSYATKEYVDNEINDLDIEFPVTSVNGQTGDVDINIPEVDLSEYAKTVDVEREINDTKLYIDTEIENIDIPEVDLSDYAKLEQLQDLTTKEYVDELNTQTRVYVDNKVDEIDVPDVSDIIEFMSVKVYANMKVEIEDNFITFNIENLRNTSIFNRVETEFILKTSSGNATGIETGIISSNKVNLSRSSDVNINKEKSKEFYDNLTFYPIYLKKNNSMFKLVYCKIDSVRIIN